MKEEIIRCGGCGDYNATAEVLNSFTEEELKARTVIGDCGGCNGGREQPYEPTPREMMEAGIISRSEFENL